MTRTRAEIHEAAIEADRGRMRMRKLDAERRYYIGYEVGGKLHVEKVAPERAQDRIGELVREYHGLKISGFTRRPTRRDMAFVGTRY